MSQRLSVHCGQKGSEKGHLLDTPSAASVCIPPAAMLSALETLSHVGLMVQASGVGFTQGHVPPGGQPATDNWPVLQFKAPAFLLQLQDNTAGLSRSPSSPGGSLRLW